MSNTTLGLCEGELLLIHEFTLIALKLPCADINECEEQTHNCSLNEECKNSRGSFKCKCKPGLTGEDCEQGTNK